MGHDLVVVPFNCVVRLAGLLQIASHLTIYTETHDTLRLHEHGARAPVCPHLKGKQIH